MLTGIRAPWGVYNRVQLSTSRNLGRLRELARYWALSIAFASQDRVGLVLFSLRFERSGWAVKKRVYLGLWNKLVFDKLRGE